MASRRPRLAARPNIGIKVSTAKSHEQEISCTAENPPDAPPPNAASSTSDGVEILTKQNTEVTPDELTASTTASSVSGDALPDSSSAVKVSDSVTENKTVVRRLRGNIRPVISRPPKTNDVDTPVRLDDPCDKSGAGDVGNPNIKPVSSPSIVIPSASKSTVSINKPLPSPTNARSLCDSAGASVAKGNKSLLIGGDESYENKGDKSCLGTAATQGSDSSEGAAQTGLYVQPKTQLDINKTDILQPVSDHLEIGLNGESTSYVQVTPLPHSAVSENTLPLLRPSSPIRTGSNLASEAGSINDTVTPIVSPKHARKKRPHKKRRKVLHSAAPPDTSKMTLKELIYFQPTSNPLVQASKSAQPSLNLPTLRESNSRAQSPALSTAPESAEQSEEEETEVSMAPQIMIGEDGEVVINERSLTVDAPKEKAPAFMERVEEHGDQVTYASFRKSTSTKFWTQIDTDNFYKALNAIGTDFSLMCQLFPKRTRAELKNKFKKEERVNLAKVNMALKGQLKFDAEPFPEVTPEQKKKQKPPKPEKEKKRRNVSKTTRTFYEESDEERKTKKHKKKDVLDSSLAGAPSLTGVGDSQSAVVELEVDVTPSAAMLQPPQAPVPVHPVTPQLSAPTGPHVLADGPTVPRNSNAWASEDQASSNFTNAPMAAARSPNVITRFTMPASPDREPNLGTPSRTPFSNSPIVSPLLVQHDGAPALSSLKAGQYIVVQSESLSNSNTKLHHLYLYTPPRPLHTSTSPTVANHPVGITRFTPTGPINPGQMCQLVCSPLLVGEHSPLTLPAGSLRPAASDQLNVQPLPITS